MPRKLHGCMAGAQRKGDADAWIPVTRNKRGNKRRNLADKYLKNVVFYGNTQAIIFDTYIAADSSTAICKGRCYDYSSTEATAIIPDPRLDSAKEKQQQVFELEDNIIRQDLTTPSRNINHLTTVLEADDYSKSLPASCMSARQAFSAYRAYPKLFGERRHAQNYPSKEIKGSLLDLPGEIRNQIYRLALTIEPAIEFAPVASTYYDQCRARDHAIILRRKTIRPALRFLRTNHQINREAAEIYYGENDFRFSNADGWYFLLAFLKTIGPANLARLRSITISVPGLGNGSAVLPLHRGLQETLFESRDEYIVEAFEALALSFNHVPTTHNIMDTEYNQGFWPFEKVFQECVSEALSLLAATGKLELLRFLLRTDYDIEPNDLSLHPPLDWLNWGNLTIQLVHLLKFGEEVGKLTGRIGVRKNEEFRQYFEKDDDLAKHMGWECRVAMFDDDCRYKVIEASELKIVYSVGDWQYP